MERHPQEGASVAIPDHPDQELHDWFGSPTLRAKGAIASTRASEDERTMTVGGTALRALILFQIALVVVATVWAFDERGTDVTALFWLGLVGGLIVGLFTAASPMRARYTAPLYAALEGLSLGALTVVVERWYPGIPRNALLLTGAVFCFVLGGYLVLPGRVTASFRFGVVVATGAVAALYMADIALHLITGRPMALLHESGWIAVAISLVIVTIAALNLILDFDYIERHAAEGAPARLEWFGAFSLMVTVVWLYVELLRLLLLLGGDD